MDKVPRGTDPDVRDDYRPVVGDAWSGGTVRRSPSAVVPVLDQVSGRSSHSCICMDWRSETLSGVAELLGEGVSLSPAALQRLEAQWQQGIRYLEAVA